jgi:hypothetical protein
MFETERELSQLAAGSPRLNASLPCQNLLAVHALRIGTIRAPIQGQWQAAPDVRPPFRIYVAFGGDEALNKEYKRSLPYKLGKLERRILMKAEPNLSLITLAFRAHAMSSQSFTLSARGTNSVSDQYDMS